MAIIIIGFLLMSSAGSKRTYLRYSYFSVLVVSLWHQTSYPLIGFLFWIIYAVIHKPKDQNKDRENSLSLNSL